VDWDSTILDFESLSASPEAEAVGINSTVLLSTRNDNFRLGGWITNDFIDGTSLPENTTLFTACFVAKAEGDPNIRVEENLPTNPATEESDLEIEVVDLDGNPIPFTSDLCPTLEIIPPPAAGDINVTTDIISPCSGQDNGKLSFSFVGGMPPYSLDLRGGNGFDENFIIFGQDTIIEGLAVDDYSYFVIDEGNTAQAISPIGDPIRVREIELNITFNEQFPNCVGENSGSLTAIPLIFNTPADDPDEYTYSWSTGINDTLQILDSLTAGVYEVTITNANGCTAVDDENLFDPQALVIERINMTPAQCSGTFDGSLEAVITGGTGTIDFEWDIDPTINNNIIPGLDVGDYTLIVTDMNGCTATDNSRVNGAIEITVDTQLKSDVQCFNAEDGMIQISPISNLSVDIANWNYAWSPNANPMDITSNGAISVADSLSPGTYEVTLTNSDIDSQCFGTAQFEITEPDSLMLEIDITNISRCQLNIPDGSATVMASGGTPSPAGYDYIWSEIGLEDNPSANTAGATAMNLNADTIMVSVSDANGCITLIDTVVGSPAPPNIIEFNNNSIDCANDSDGFLQVTAGPGDTPIQQNNYMWSGPNNVPSRIGIAGSLEVGTYTVTIIDENDCITIDSAEVIAPPAFDYSSFVVTAEPCFEAEDGAFFLELTGGTPGYTYAWFDENMQEVAGQTTSVRDLTAGNYTINGTDGNGCVIDTTVELTSQAQIVVVFDEIMETSCALSNSPDGSARATASYAGGVIGDFDFIWGSSERDDRVSQSTAVQLGSGNISVVVFESDGTCNTTAEVFIDSPSEITYNGDPSNGTEDIINVTCFGMDDGEITTFNAASGGTPGMAGYLFEWTQVATGNTLIGESISDLTAGDYTLVISDENDCLSSPITRNITEPTLLTAVIDTDPNNTRDVSCAGDDNGQITVIATGGNDDLGPYTYEWTNNVSFESVATDLAPNITYEIVVSDANGCEATVERLIQEPADLDPYNFSFDPIQCFGEFTNIRLDPASFSGGNGGDFTYTIDGCPERDVNEPSCQVRAGSLPITVFDSGGCTIRWSDRIKCRNI